MSLNLTNIASLIQNTSNQNVVESNMLKLDRKLRSIQEESKKLQDEKSRLRRLKKSIDSEKAQLQTQKSAIQNQQETIRHQMAKTKSAQSLVTAATLEQRKEHKNLQKTLSQISKELTTTKRKLMSEQRKGHGDKQKKLKSMQRRYEAEKKNNKLMKREFDSVLAELSITKRKLMTAQRKGGKGGTSDAKYKALLRKWMKERKKLKLALMEFEDRANFHRRQIANFKKQQTKWLRQQKSTLKSKKHAVKFVFMDDMAAIKINNKYKDRVKIITTKGKEILVEKVRVIIEKGPKKNKKKKAKRKGKSGKPKLEFEGDDPSWIEQDQIVQQLLDDISKEDDYASSFFTTEEANGNPEEEEDDDAFDDLQLIRGDVMEWKDEMTQRNEDMSILMSIAMNYSRDGDRNEHLNFDELIDGIVERHKARFEEMNDELDQDIAGVGSPVEEEEKQQTKRNKNAYDESNKLLKDECDEYLHSLQDAITSIQSIVDANRVAKPTKRLSFIPAKTATASSQSLLSVNSPITPVFSPLTPQLLAGQSTPSLSAPNAHSMQLSAEFSADSLSMFNPYTIAQELSQFYLEELNARGKDIQMMLEIFYSSYSKQDKHGFQHLDEIVRGIDERMDEVEDTDDLVVQYLVHMQNWKAQIQEYAMRMALLMRELAERREEVKQLFDVIDISEGGKAIVHRIQTLSGKIGSRHETVPQIVNHSRYEAILGNATKHGQSGSSEEDEEDEEPQPQEEEEEESIDVLAILQNVSGFEHENEEWRALIAALSAEAKKHSRQDTWKASKKRNSVAPSKIVQNSVQRSMGEVDSRTADVEQLKLVLLSRDSQTAGDLLNGIEDRHKALNEANDDIIASHSSCVDYCVSEAKNALWWKVIEDIVLNNKIMKKEKKKKTATGHHKTYESSSLSLMRPSVPQAQEAAKKKRKGTIRGVDYNANLKFVLSNSSSSKSTVKRDEFDQADEAGWWLMLDEARNAVIGSFELATTRKDVLCKLAVYVSRILKDDDECALYIPIVSPQLRALHTFFDGVLIAKLLCLINADCIDFRAIHQANAVNAYPLGEHQINENISVILSSLKSMGLAIIGSVCDWWNPRKHCDLLIAILKQIASHTIDRFCSYKSHRELALLAKKGETYATLSSFDGEKWMIRWINYMTKRNGDLDNHHAIRMNKDLMRILTTLKKRSSVLLSKANASKLDHAKAFIKIAKTSFNVETPMEAQDFSTNNRFCQMYFAAQIFNKMNGLSLAAADEEEEKEEAEIEESIMAWLNSFGLRNRVDSFDDLTSGILLLKVLDRLKKGAVSWKKVHLRVRHKFDHVVNCNYVVDICSQQLGLRFVNISGMDIVNKNTQIIKSILWRIMRYQSVKILSDLSATNVQMNNADIIKWCNEKCDFKAIQHLNDLSLTSGIYYLELIRAVMPNAIRTDLVHFKVLPLSKHIKKEFHLHDKHYKKRKQNLKYAITIIRRFGLDLFINIEDLLRRESRAVISILAAVMTIALSKQSINATTTAALTVDQIDIDSVLDSVDSEYQK